MNLRSHSRSSPEWFALLVRWILGGIFVYMGLVKAAHPVDFLKLLRQYEIIDSHLVLNSIVVALPWFEVFCGLLLLAGIAVRGSALILLLMLIPFSLIVLHRALAIREASAMAFCAIRFDCGCGAGEVNICHKLLENGLLILLAALLLPFGPTDGVFGRGRGYSRSSGHARRA